MPIYTWLLGHLLEHGQCGRRHMGGGGTDTPPPQQPSTIICSSAKNEAPPPIHAEMSNGFILCRSYIGNHIWHEVRSALLLSYPEDCFTQSFPTLSVFPLHLFLRCSLRTGGRRCDICVPFMAEHSTSTYSVPLTSWESLYSLPPTRQRRFFHEEWEWP